SFSCHGHPRTLPSFPTRRSSDLTNFQGERLVASIGAVAGMDQLVQESLRYGNERSAFERPLIKFQVWRHKFVEHLTAIEAARWRSEEHTSELQSRGHLVCRLLLE